MQVNPTVVVGTSVEDLDDNTDIRGLERPPLTFTITARNFKVERIIDGDTFEIEYDGEPTSVRLVNIDAPELRDAGGPAAKAALAELIGGRVVRIEFTEPRKRDNFGRLLCLVYVDGVDVGAVMVRGGNAYAID